MMKKNVGAEQAPPIYAVLSFLVILITIFAQTPALSTTSETKIARLETVPTNGEINSPSRYPDRVPTITPAGEEGRDATMLSNEIGSVVRNRTDKKNPQTFAPRYTEDPQTEQNYPLFRAHAQRYYPELDVQKATRLSALMPGFGQAYAGNYTKATLFLTAELGTFALAGYNLARALHYNDHGDFETGFHDPRTGEFLNADQARARMINHTFFGGIFLLTGIGLHIWNVLDAPKTASAYNNRRFAVQMQQTESGLSSLIFTHRF